MVYRQLYWLSGKQCRKNTSIGKLANKFKSKEKCNASCCRCTEQQQLNSMTEWANRSGVCISNEEGADPNLVYDGIQVQE